MPSMITHYLASEKILNSLHTQSMQSRLKKELDLYTLGSNGPDFLFYANCKPKDFYKSHRLNRLGSKMHSEKINAFYEHAISCLLAQKDSAIFDRMFAYLCGHLTHWALDSTCHPYIFYHCGRGKLMHANFHHQMESAIDCEMLKREKCCDIESFANYELIQVNDVNVQAIARFYVSIAQSVYHEKIYVYDIRKAMQSWRDILRFFYDPAMKKYKWFKNIEILIKQPYLFTGYIVRNQQDDHIDVLNQAHSAWCHPCDSSLRFTSSFLDLYEEGCDRGVRAIEFLDNVVNQGGKQEKLLVFLDDKAYDSGLNTYKEMCNSKIIYHP